MRRYLLSSAVFAILATSTQAAVIFNDTFDAGTGNWYVARTTSSVANASQQLAFSTTNTTGEDRMIGKAFAAQTLANVGDVLRLTFDMKQSGQLGLYRVGVFNITSTPAANDWNNTPANAPSASIHNSTFSGYYSFLRDSTFNTSANLARKDSSAVGTPAYTAAANAPTLLTDVNLNSGSSPATYNIAVDNSVTYSVIFELTRTAAGTVQTLMTMTDKNNVLSTVSVTGVDSSSPYITFNSVFLQSASGGVANTTTTLDNIKLEYLPVPEPTSLSLLGLGSLLLGRRRRA